MFSGRERAAVHRQNAIAWAWSKARGINKNRANSTHAKLMSSVLLTSDCGQTEEISSWRDSLAAFNYRSLAHQICDQFYDISLLSERLCSNTDPTASERVLGSALLTYCVLETKAQLMHDPVGEQKTVKARIMSAVLPDRRARRGVLISIKTWAA